MFSTIKLFSVLLIAQMPCMSDLHGIFLINHSAKIKMQTLQVKKDSTAFIKLKSLSTSGYVWSCTIEDSSIVTVEKKGNEFPSARPKRVGDSGLEVFAVKGLRSGDTKIFFIQKRPWKNGGEPIKSANYTVRVDE
jgi:predicted secreted protein